MRAMAAVISIRFVIFFTIAVTGRVVPAQVDSNSADRERGLRDFLFHYAESKRATADETRYASSFVDLNGDGLKEIVVYLTGRYWCGTGGCLTLVLAPQVNSYRIVGKILATRPPIRALGQTTHGWRTLTARVQGGGILNPYEARLPFDGKRYPTSAAPPSARRLMGGLNGDVLIPASAEDPRNQRLLSGAP